MQWVWAPLGKRCPLTSAGWHADGPRPQWVEVRLHSKVLHVNFRLRAKDRFANDGQTVSKVDTARTPCCCSETRTCCSESWRVRRRQNEQLRLLPGCAKKMYQCLQV